MYESIRTYNSIRSDTGYSGGDLEAKGQSLLTLGGRSVATPPQHAQTLSTPTSNALLQGRQKLLWSQNGAMQITELFRLAAHPLGLNQYVIYTNTIHNIETYSRSVTCLV